jgi:hypothetical protein
LLLTTTPTFAADLTHVPYVRCAAGGGKAQYNYLVHCTPNSEATIQFLCDLTHELIAYYRNTGVPVRDHPLPPPLLQRSASALASASASDAAASAPLASASGDSAPPAPNPEGERLEWFNERMGKSTQRNVFATQLRTIKGISAERAAAILELYPTGL